MRAIYKFIYFKLLGWKIKGSFSKEVKKCIIAVVPHTSWHDFYIGLMIRSITKTKINYIAKKELFKFPFGWYFRWTGGAPIDRTPGQNKVQAIASIFKEKKEFRLTLAPEGTRNLVTELRTGFYYIAKEAKVPITLVAFDFGKKEVKIDTPFYPTDNIKADFAYIHKFYEGVVGKIPEKSFGYSA
jgi:1-acyl-sn-glycerol-3-phosphate acyltransferase